MGERCPIVIGDDASGSEPNETAANRAAESL